VLAYVLGTIRLHGLEYLQLIFAMQNLIQVYLWQAGCVCEATELFNSPGLGYGGESLEVLIVLISKFEVLSVQLVFQVEPDGESVEYRFMRGQGHLIFLIDLANQRAGVKRCVRVAFRFHINIF
jgi:hypothetical protein